MAWTNPTAPSTGDVLTATKYANEVVNNGLFLYGRDGLQPISTNAVGSGVSTFTVTSAFSSTYDNYLIEISSLATSFANTSLLIRLGTSTTRTDYSYAGHNIQYSAGTVTVDSASSTANGFLAGYTSSSGVVSSQIVITSPFLAVAKTGYAQYATNNRAGWASSYDALASSQTQFVLYPFSGTMTGGTVRVYGFSN